MPSRQQRKPAGDATGRKAEELQAQHHAELKARSDQLTIAQRLDEDGEGEVVDLTGSTTLAPGTRQPGMPGTSLDDDGMMTVEGQEEIPVQTNNTPVIGQGPESPSNVPGATPYDQRMRELVDTDNAPAAQILGANAVVDTGHAGAAVLIRVNTDLPEVTIGTGNHYSFEQGKQYRVPRHVADHLEEKGLVWH